MGILEPSNAPYSNRWFTCSKEEWVTPVYSRFTTGEQGHDPELRSRSDSGRIPEHTKAMKKLKKTLRRAEALKRSSYDRPIIVTVDTSPTGIGWVINQADSDGLRYPIRFGATVLNERQRGNAQVKRE